MEKMRKILGKYASRIGASTENLSRFDRFAKRQYIEICQGRKFCYIFQ
jgi:hypothetical protein